MALEELVPIIFELGAWYIMMEIKLLTTTKHIFFVKRLIYLYIYIYIVFFTYKDMPKGRSFNFYIYFIHY